MKTIKIKIIRDTSTVIKDLYQITSLTGAVAVFSCVGDTKKHHCGDFLNEKQVESLIECYEVNICLK